MKKAGNIARKYQLGAITLEFTEEGTIQLTRGPTRTTNPERLTWRQGPAYEILTDFVHALATDGPGVEPPHAVAFRDAVRKALFKADPEWATREKVSEALCAELAIGRLQTHAGNGELLAKLVEDVFEKHVLHWKGYAGNNLIDRVDSALKSLSEYRSIWLKAASGVMEESPDFVSETDPDVAVANAFNMAEMLPRYIRKLKEDWSELHDKFRAAEAERQNTYAALDRADPGWRTHPDVAEGASTWVAVEAAIVRLKNDADHAKAAELNAIDRMENANTERDNWQAGAKKICDENEQLLRKIAYLGDQVISLTGQNATLQSDLMSARALLDVGAARVKEVTEQNETLARSLADEQLTSRSLRLERDNLEKQNVAANQKLKDLEGVKSPLGFVDGYSYTNDPEVGRKFNIELEVSPDLAAKIKDPWTGGHPDCRCVLNINAPEVRIQGDVVFCKETGKTLNSFGGVELGCGYAIPRRPIKVTTTDRVGDLEHTETLEFSPHSVEAQAAQAWQDGFEAKFRELLRDSNLSLAEIAIVTGIAKSFGCKGKNCGSVDPRNHSTECQAEHEEAVGGYYGSEDTTPYAAEQLRRYIWILTGEEPAQDVAERIVDDISRILNN